MSTRRRDRVIAGLAVVLVALTVGLVLATVLQAKRAGTQALEELQRDQVQQLSKSFDSRVVSALDALDNFASAPPPWSATVRNSKDADRIAQLQAYNPGAKTGMVILDRNLVVANGTLLRDPSIVGRPLTRPGLAAVLDGKPVLLPVGPGLTTALPTIAFAFPLRNARSQVIGAFLFESEVSTDSDFSKEVGQLKRGRTGAFSFVDSTGVVVASSNPGLLGRPLDEQLVKGGRSGFYRGDGRVAAAERVESVGWWTVFTQDAEEFEGSLTGPLDSALLFVLIAGAIGAGVGFVLLSRRLRRARQEQRRLEQIAAAREEFISIVSHELRTPVTGLLGFLQTTLDHWDIMGDEERRRAVGRAQSSARRLHALTRDVLEASSMESGALEYAFTAIDLRDEISSAASAVRDLMPDRMVSVSVSDQACWVHADPDRIQQVLTNLLDNALKSAPPLSPIEVTADVRDGRVRVAVTDRGPGLSADELVKVFDKFVRGRASTTVGTGLGLYICRQVIEGHGGRISAESSTGAGTTFAFELPLVAAPAEPVQA